MASFGIELKGFGFEKALKSFRLGIFQKAAAAALNRSGLAAQKAVNLAIEQEYTTSVDPKTLAYFRKATKNKLVAQIGYRYEPHPLSWFENRRIHLRRPIYATDVRVFRKQGFKRVRGRPGKRYGGFLQRKAGHIFERDQKKTWIRPGIRASYSRLYGPSISQMAASQTVAENLREQGLSTRLNSVISATLNEYL